MNEFKNCRTTYWKENKHGYKGVTQWKMVKMMMLDLANNLSGLELVEKVKLPLTAYLPHNLARETKELITMTCKISVNRHCKISHSYKPRASNKQMHITLLSWMKSLKSKEMLGSMEIKQIFKHNTLLQMNEASFNSKFIFQIFINKN